jgi:capsid protein
MGAVSLREQARWLDNNHDLVIGVFDKLEERVVGKRALLLNRSDADQRENRQETGKGYP